MELRQLRYFIAVAECLSFSKAAEELHITVPPLSRQIRQLEEEFDVQLFVRNRRRVLLSDAGRMFLREAKTLADQMTRFTRSVRQAAHGDAGTVRIGIGLHLGERLSRAVIDHSKLYPLVEIHTTGIFPASQNAALLEGKIDVGFLRPPIDQLHLNSEVLFEEHLAALVNRSNPLAKRKSVRARDLAAQTILLQDRRFSPGLHDKILEVFARSGVSPHIVELPADPLPNDDVQKVLLAANRGIYIVADEAPARMALGCAAVSVPIEEPNARVEVHMVWRRDESSPSILAFLTSLRRVFGAPQPVRSTPFMVTNSGGSR